MKQTICIDQDDVLADTHAKLVKLYLQSDAPRYELAELQEKSFQELFHEEERNAVYRQIHEPGFFADIPVMPGAQEAIVHLQERYNVFVATAAMEFPNSFRDKYDWLAEHFPTIHWKNYIFLGDKSILGANFLIDDMPYNLHTFTGKGLLFDALHNRDETAYTRVRNWTEVLGLLLD
ncbi:5'(3')-deoxyribonucleotidase [Fibrella sp. HMF5335]|uniref:5'(3')-deoxyribonucleotidase n=1 Tax=Fibrella rubiginis TaxID=2817060 RepID=A0A939GGR3_9BACT|nr:5'(3')-deoxyribonucleotidase [Fibrella rubiginis]MBO0936153.1 5'(3')-deoxyribonucleotidase [Fibrella rubiginis]